MKCVVGIDEVGRGPLAGPVSVAAVAIEKRFYEEILGEFKDLKDSKKTSANLREKWLKKIDKFPKSIFYSVSLVGNIAIDKKGIVRAIEISLSRSLGKLDLKPDKCEVLLDGSLKAPKKFKNQKTIIRGDEKEKIIAMASIVAKVYRDKHMKYQAGLFPLYGFEKHKGYGTKEHIKKIKKYGASDIHRLSFLNNLKF